MQLYNSDIERQIHDLFIELKKKSIKIASEARTNTNATERIMRLVSSTISAEVEGYIVDIYAGLLEKINKMIILKIKKI